jgi:hypothetical protein
LALYKYFLKKEETDMSKRAKHAFGMLENIEAALAAGKLDEFDILFVKDADGKPYVGWIDKEGNTVICDDSEELAALGAEIDTKVSEEEVDAKLATKADSNEVDEKITAAVTDTVATANAYTDDKIEAAINEHLVKKYEITSVPTGTLVDYRESEIRIMCPANSVWTKQAVGEGGDPNNYYATFKTYAPNDAVGYIEHLDNQVNAEILTDFSTDEYGRRYQPSWLAIAKYDDTTGEWMYHGANSTANHYIGWNYQIDWYNADDIMIASDSFRVNLSNEKCHSSIEPYYVADIMKEIDTKIDEKLVEAESYYEIMEF